MAEYLNFLIDDINSQIELKKISGDTSFLYTIDALNFPDLIMDKKILYLVSNICKYLERENFKFKLKKINEDCYEYEIILKERFNTTAAQNYINKFL